MSPAIADGDWLLIDPTIDRWPRRGTVVVFRERTTPRWPSNAWRPVRATGSRSPRATSSSPTTRRGLLSDATPEATAAAGFGEPTDSRQYGPVPVELLVGRAWFRYAPLQRFGRIPRRR